jgi:hypothetical protein
MLLWSETEKILDKMQKIKLKDYLQAMCHQHKIFNLEVLEGDMVYVGKEIKAKTKDDALRIMSLMSGGEVNSDSEIIFIEEKELH